MSLFKTPLVVLDFETSGQAPHQGARITEVAAIRIEGNAITDRYCSLVNCGIRIPYFITELTGITQKMVDNAPPAAEVVPDLLRFIGSDTLVAHNAAFDEGFLKSEADRAGIWPEYDGVICTVKLMRRVFPGLPSYSLGKLAASLGVRFQGAAHRAEADAQVTAELMLKAGMQLQQQWQLESVDPRWLMYLNQQTPAALRKNPALWQIST
ncbi:3'-5' exonuclease [Undibacterium squillarum]|uniref:DNA-directed DNA polymerase n=1 Tax=Undibacterium squillarum TaxID=1131567 RepID=A0ABQ2Y1L4_9BURK|nr:3'-5' exonuclease [Undibacterium squillarum]GGX50182.1 DNA polymerase III subunit epsilon [Undibacterium squillarum]